MSQCSCCRIVYTNKSRIDLKENMWLILPFGGIGRCRASARRRRGGPAAPPKEDPRRWREVGPTRPSTGSPEPLLLTVASSVAESSESSSLSPSLCLSDSHSLRALKLNLESATFQRQQWLTIEAKHPKNALTVTCVLCAKTHRFSLVAGLRSVGLHFVSTSRGLSGLNGFRQD